MNQSQSGRRQGFGVSIGVIIAIVVLVLAVISCCCLFFGLGTVFIAASDDSSTTSARSARESRGLDAFTRPAAQGLAGGTGTGFGLGQDVFVGSARWKVLEAQDLGNILPSNDGSSEPLTTSERFIRVRIEVENTGSEPLTFSDVILVDAQGSSFQDASDALFNFVPDQERCILEQLDPNLSRVCTTIFEVPLDATGLKVQVGDLDIFGSEVALIDLNLASGAAPAQPAPGQPDAAPPPPEPSVGRGQDVFIGQSRWKLLDAQDLGSVLESDSEDLAPLEAGGRLIRIRFEVENTSEEGTTFADLELIDSQGRRFEPSIDAIWFIDEAEQCPADELDPAVPKICTKIYDVAADASGLKAEVFDLVTFDAGMALLDLGF